MIHSLDMTVTIVGPFYSIAAPWLDKPVEALTFEWAYELAMLARRRRA